MFAEGFDLADCVQEWSIVRGGRGEVSRAHWSPGQDLPGDLLATNAASVALRVVKPIDHASFTAGDSRAASAASSASSRKVRVPRCSVGSLPVYRIEDQPAGATGEGPCILEEAYFTGRIAAGWRFAINAQRDTLLERIDQDPPARRQAVRGAG